MNNKGFTLVELVATIVLLMLVASLGAYSVINIINNSKEKNYESMIKNIKDAAETYYMECTYSKEEATDATVSCTKSGSYYVLTLGDLVKYGYITGNSKDSSGKYKIINPKTAADINTCSIKISVTDGSVTANNATGSCPTSY